MEKVDLREISKETLRKPHVLTSKAFYELLEEAMTEAIKAAIPKILQIAADRAKLKPIDPKAECWCRIDKSSITEIPVETILKEIL